MGRESRATPGSAEPALQHVDVAELPPGSYWEAHGYIGEIMLADHSKVLINTVLKEGAWYVRLRAYRLAQRGKNQDWVPARQIMIFPPHVLGALRGFLEAAEQAIAAVPAGGDGLSAAELAQESASELPDREALSLIIPGLFEDAASTGAAYRPDGS